MIASLVFLGCPLRMVLRLAGGDLNALLGIAGFAFGIWIGTLFLKRGFTLGRSTAMHKGNGGAVMPLISIALIALLVAAPAFIFFSETGPGSMHAPLILALLAGIIVGGVVAQRSRLCLAGGESET